MMHKVNVEQLEDSMRLLEKNLEEFKLEMMVGIYQRISIYHAAINMYIHTYAKCIKQCF